MYINDKLYKILHILKHEHEMYLMLNEYLVDYFDKHFQVYFLKEKTINIMCLNFKMLCFEKPFELHKLNNKECFILRHI